MMLRLVLGSLRARTLTVATTILAIAVSVALLLAHVGERRAAARIDSAVEDHLATRGETSLSTTAVGERILGKL